MRCFTVMGAGGIAQLFLRAGALGSVAGVVATLAISMNTEALRAAPSKAFLLAGPVVLFFVTIFGLLVVGFAAFGVVAQRLGAAGGGFTTPGFLWSMLALACAFVALEHLRETIEWMQLARGPLRVVLGAGAAVVIWRAWRESGDGVSPSVLHAERFAVLLLLPATILAGLYYRIPREAVGGPVDAGSVIALAPHFESEPPGTIDALAKRPRILLLGIDGASWDRIDKGVAAGKLPTFARLVGAGRRAPLQTLRPTESPAIWTSMVTGVAPRVHGIDTFYMFQIPRLGLQRLDIPRSLDLVEEFLTGIGELVRVPVTSSLRRRKALWNLVDEAGLSTAVLGLWATWPPEPLDHGLVVSDHASVAKRREWLDRRKTSALTVGTTMYPPTLERRLGRYQRSPESVTRSDLEQFIPVDDETWRRFGQATTFSKDRPLSAFRATHLSDAFIFDAATEVWESDRPDLMIAYVRAIDDLSHFFYEASVAEAQELGFDAEEITMYGGVVDRVYEWTDRRMARLVEMVDAEPGTLLIIVSDHGWEKEADGRYNHRFAPPGIVLFYGADVCTHGCHPLPELSIYDIAPTVLERLGLPLSSELLGSPVPAFSSPNPVTRVAHYGRPVGDAAGIVSADDSAMLEKLRALGYLE